MEVNIITSKQAEELLRKDFSVRAIIKSKKRPFATLAKELDVQESVISNWFAGKSQPTKAQFNKLYKLRESTAKGYTRYDKLLSIAFRHQYIPEDVITGKVTDPKVLYYYGII